MFFSDRRISKESLRAALAATSDDLVLRHSQRIAAHLSEQETFPELVDELSTEGEEAAYALARLVKQVVADPHVRDRSTKRMQVPDYALVLVTGDLDVAGTVRNGGTLMVLGNLSIGGVYWDGSESCLLIVLGSVTTRRADVLGGAYVGGDWRVNECFHGVSHSWNVCVRGCLEAPLILFEDDKPLEAGRVACELPIGIRSGSTPAELAAKARERLVPAVLLPPGHDTEALPVDLEKLADRMRRGLKVLRSD